MCLWHRLCWWWFHGFMPFYLQTHQVVYIKCIELFVCQSHLNKVVLKWFGGEWVSNTKLLHQSLLIEIYTVFQKNYTNSPPKEKKGRSMHIPKKNTTMYGDGCQLDLLQLSFHNIYKPQIIILYTWN